MTIQPEKTDQHGYDAEYQGQELRETGGLDAFVKKFERSLLPHAKGGETKGYVRSVATERLFEAADVTGQPYSEISVVDAGCGLGGLSVYLAARGFRVFGVDISKEGCASAQGFADKMGVGDRCRFLAESLESMSLDDHSIDFIIGHASLHHFIKYERVPAEFRRVLKPGGQGFFGDAFGENKAFRLFHDKEKMRRLGDVSLTRVMIIDYFDGFEVEIIPTDWFVMLDKLYLKIARGRAQPAIRSLSAINFWLDRRMPSKSRLALRLSGSVATFIRMK